MTVKVNRFRQEKACKLKGVHGSLHYNMGHGPALRFPHVEFILSVVGLYFTIIAVRIICKFRMETLLCALASA